MAQISANERDTDETPSPTEHQFCVGTHDGRFHADDVLAVGMLLYLSDSVPRVERTRDPAKLALCSHVVDVGKVYDLSSNRFDHHQTSCHETFPGSEIPLSASGLVYRDLGKQIIDKVLEENQLELKTTVDLDRNQLINLVYSAVYHRFMAEVDAVDNGYKRYHDEDYAKVREMERYSQFSNFSSLIASFNYHEHHHPQQLAQFGVAVQTAWNLMRQCILNQLKFAQAQMIETTALERLLRDREAVGANKHCLILKSQYKTVRSFLKKHDTERQIKFTISPRRPGEWGIYTVQYQSFTNLVDLISEERAHELIESSELFESDQLIFIHKKRFVGVTRSVEMATQLVDWSMQAYWDEQEERNQAALAKGARMLSASWSQSAEQKSTPEHMDISTPPVPPTSSQTPASPRSSAAPAVAPAPPTPPPTPPSTQTPAPAETQPTDPESDPEPDPEPANKWWKIGGAAAVALLSVAAIAYVRRRC